MLRSLWRRATHKFRKRAEYNADIAAEMRRSRALETGALILAMRGVITLLMINLRRAGKLDDNAIAALKRDAVGMIKNFETEGISIEEETAPFREAIQKIEQVIDFAVESARGNDEI